MGENSAKSKHTGNGVEKGPSRDVGGLRELRSQLVALGVRYLWADGG